MKNKTFNILTLISTVTVAACASVKYVIENKIYDKNGFNRKGYNREGYDKNGYDKKGFDSLGFDKSGKDFAKMTIEDRKFFAEELNKIFMTAEHLIEKKMYRPALNSFRTILEAICKNHLKHYDYLSYSTIDADDTNMESLLEVCKDLDIWTEDEINRMYEAKKYGNIGSHYLPIPDYNKIHFTMCTTKEEMERWCKIYPYE